MRLKTAPLVSVVVPSYCHEDFILECLASIHSQTYDNIELVVVDDVSKDETFERARGLLKTPFRKRFKNVILIRNDENLGAHESINRGIQASHGELISIVNSDDVFHPDRLSQLVSAMLNQQRDLAFGLVDVLVTGKRGNALPTFSRLLPVKQRIGLQRDPTFGLSLLRSNWAISTGNLVFSRELFKKVGNFQPLRYCHDWDFVLQSLFYTEPAVVFEPLYYYRIHGSNSFSSLGHVAEIETEIVLRRFIRRGLLGISPNELFPSESNWPGFFHAFMNGCGYSGFFERESGGRMQGWRTYDS